MGSEKTGFDEFLATVDGEHREWVELLHRELGNRGCTLTVKSAKSGYVVSYLCHKKTIANYIFRKKGMFVRIYANHVNQYSEFMDTLPDGMIEVIREAPVCKRLVNPADCNPKCAMGYDFILRGERLQKCRISAFQFLVCDQDKPFIQAFLLREADASSCV